MPAKFGSCSFDGHRLVYDDYGAGDQLIVLLPGLLLSRAMHTALAEALAERGHRVVPRLAGPRRLRRRARS